MSHNFYYNKFVLTAILPKRGEGMKNNIHPNYNMVEVTCACGAKYNIGTTKNVDSMKVEICSECHPFYTGKQKTIQSGGRVERFNKRFGEGSLK